MAIPIQSLLWSIFGDKNLFNNESTCGFVPFGAWSCTVWYRTWADVTHNMWIWMKKYVFAQMFGTFNNYRHIWNQNNSSKLENNPDNEQRNVTFFLEWPWISPWIKPISNELDILFTWSRHNCLKIVTSSAIDCDVISKTKTERVGHGDDV